MNYREEFFSKEANLVNVSKRELANGLHKSPAHKLRLLCFSKGIKGLMDLARTFRKLDQNDDNLLNESEFVTGLKCMDLITDPTEATNAFHYFDENHDGFIDITEFIHKLRPPLRKSRLELIEKAFNKIDHNDDGIITIEDLKHIYNVRDHPKYLSGELSEQEILMQFIQNFLSTTDNIAAGVDSTNTLMTGHGYYNKKAQTTTISREDFINYYVGVSASIDNDAYFDLVMRRAYKF